MREDSATVRMQLLDPSKIKRVGLDRRGPGVMGAQSGLEGVVYASKENLVVDFETIELSHDQVLL